MRSDDGQTFQHRPFVERVLHQDRLEQEERVCERWCAQRALQFTLPAQHRPCYDVELIHASLGLAGQRFFAPVVREVAFWFQKTQRAVCNQQTCEKIINITTKLFELNETGLVVVGCHARRTKFNAKWMPCQTDKQPTTIHLSDTNLTMSEEDARKQRTRTAPECELDETGPSVGAKLITETRNLYRKPHQGLPFRIEGSCLLHIY